VLFCNDAASQQKLRRIWCAKKSAPRPHKRIRWHPFV
jgi:hypothetical protein